MADFRVDSDACGVLNRDQTTGCCMPRVEDGRCVWCEREIPTKRELEAQADAPIPYRLTEHGRRAVAGLETSAADVCAGCGADRLEIQNQGHRRIDHTGAQITDGGPALVCPEACSCPKPTKALTLGLPAEHFNMAEHRAWSDEQAAG